MRTRLFVIGLVFLIILVGIATYYVRDHLVAKEEVMMEFDFETKAREMGFNVDRDMLHFGGICQGCTAKRRLDLFNNHTYPVRIRFFVGAYNHTEAARWFYFEPPTGWILEPGENQSFKVIVFPPKNAPLQWYRGVVFINTYKAWPWEDKWDYAAPPELHGCFSKDFIEMIFNCDRNRKSNSTKAGNISTNNTAVINVS